MTWLPYFSCGKSNQHTWQHIQKFRISICKLLVLTLEIEGNELNEVKQCLRWAFSGNQWYRIQTLIWNFISRCFLIAIDKLLLAVGILKCICSVLLRGASATKIHHMWQNCNWRKWRTYSSPSHYSRSEIEQLGRLDCRLYMVSVPRRTQSDIGSWTSYGSVITLDLLASVWEVQE